MTHEGNRSSVVHSVTSVTGPKFLSRGGRSPPGAATRAVNTNPLTRPGCVSGTTKLRGRQAPSSQDPSSRAGPDKAAKTQWLPSSSPNLMLAGERQEMLWHSGGVIWRAGGKMPGAELRHTSQRRQGGGLPVDLWMAAPQGLYTAGSSQTCAAWTPPS